MKKICNKCKIEKELTSFRKNTYTKDGLRSICKLCDTITIKIWHSKNKERHAKTGKKYRENNKESIRLAHQKYEKENRSILNEKRFIKLKNNPLQKLSANLRTLISGTFKNKGYSKKSKTCNILGCSFEEFKLHIETNFEEWMNWQNHGKYNYLPNTGWDLDHIIPLNSAKTEEDVIKLNHYSNFQPLCSYINRNVKKGNLNYSKI
jgi:hypothetical protein